MDKRTIYTYNKLAREYDQETTGFWKDFPTHMLDRFVDALPNIQVLNLGSGPGRDGLLLKQRGCDVTCLDASREMVNMCKTRGLMAAEGDLLSLPFPDHSFGGVWAYTSLLHIHKTEMPHALAETRRVLTPDGVFAIGMIEGDGELYRESFGVCLPRLFALYAKEELEELLQNAGFTVTYFETIQPRTKTYLHIIAIPQY